MLSATDEYMMREMLEYKGMDKVEEVLKSGQSIATVLGHFGNWELLSCTKLAVPGFKDWTLGLIYHALRNRDFDRLFLDIRSAHHGTCIDKHDILRELVKLKKDGRVSLFGYILDQSAKWDSIHLWLPFLNHDTPVFTGAERIARKFKNAVFYIDMQRPKRGKYIFDFQLVTLAPQDMEENELTRETFKLLEASIRRQPECYLWTHNRWKRTHEEYNQKVASGELKG
jgi:KDO2-lipid IV(A) lauroyltransferase